ncbi:MAG TPA: glutamine amidotransferase, partial [Terriglobia bacterium]|nr:glutamine amidotransferase [Terriglobia bacterium]
LTFQLLASRWMFIPLALVAIAVAIYFYQRVAKEKLSLGMIVMRSLVFIILLFMFLQPVMNVSEVLPQDSYMAVVVDTSQSMNIKDDGETSRAQMLLKKIEETNFFQELSKKFKVRLFAFNREAQRIEATEQLNFNGTRTRLEAPIELLQQEMGTLPMVGVVLMSDGVDNASQQFNEAFNRFQKRRVPFYAVGVGSEEIVRDAEIIRVTAPREMLKDSTAVVDLQFKSAGLSGRKAVIDVRENTTLAKTHDVTLPPDGQVGEVSIDVPVKNEGNQVFSFSIRVPDDRIAENNTLDALVTVRNDHPKILYIEGEPRWEYKYSRRAIEDDPNLVVESLLRSSQNKFYRQGIEDKTALEDGFPKTKEELFAYSGVMLGSVESTFFQPDQLEMIVDFVKERGGGFLMMGGKNSFSSGRYQNSPIADILPVELLPNAGLPVVGKVQLELTDYGRSHNLMRLSDNPATNAKIWAQLPPLEDFNRVGDVKPGGVVLARGEPESGDGNPILLAYQRYGRGRSMVFTTGSSWHWQMGMDDEDPTHELVWKQMLRWLVSASPAAVSVTTDKDTYLPGELVNVSADVADKEFKRLNNARVTARVTGPDGNNEELALDWSGSQDGTYQTSVTAATKEGTYTVDMEAFQGTERVGSYKTAFQIKDRPVEFYDAALDAGNLRSIATQSGGRYYPLA